MAQLFFKYGTMAAGKSLQLLAIADNYRRTNKDVLILTSFLDTRSKNNRVVSRVGLSDNAVSIAPDVDIIKCISYHLPTMAGTGQTIWPACILVDEAEFLTSQQITDLATIVDTYNVPVICFGLKTDFKGKLFEGSKALLELADKIEVFVDGVIIKQP